MDATAIVKLSLIHFVLVKEQTHVQFAKTELLQLQKLVSILAQWMVVQINANYCQMQFVMLLRLVVQSVETEFIQQVQVTLKDVTMEIEMIMMDVQLIASLKPIQLVLIQLELKVFVEDVDLLPYNLQKYVMMETM